MRDNGIHAQVFNEFSHGAVGELPFTHTYPEVWVEYDRDEANARLIVENFESRVAVSGELICPSCSQPNPANFEICWNCSTILSAD
jgi:hypothetical protein